MDELLRRWAELEPGALTYIPAGEDADRLQVSGRNVERVAPGWADDADGQGWLLHALWAVIEVRGWRWVMLFAPVGEGLPPYLARVTARATGEGETQRGRTPAHALLAAYVALLDTRGPH